MTASQPIPNLLAGMLEDQYEPLVDFEELASLDPMDVLILGGGHISDPDLPATDQLSDPAQSRLVEGVRIFRQIPDSRVIVSGYGRKSSVSQAEVLRNAAISLGIPEDQIIMQKEPTNTFEEARQYLDQFGADRELILVTSAAHMPRAIYLFRELGLNPIAAPTDFLVKDDPLVGYQFGLFSYRNFVKVESALHEYIGMLWAKYGGE